MDGVAESTIKTLFEAGKISNILSLYHLTEKSFNGVNGFGESKIKNLLAQIEQTKEMSIGQFVDAIGVDLVGEKAMTKMGISSVPELWAFKDETSVVGQNLIAYLKGNKDFVKELLDVVTIIAPKVKAKGARSIAMTGKGPEGRDALAKKIEANGDVFSEHVGKDTDILLVEDKNSQSSKIVKAQKLGIKIVNYDEYFK